MKQDEMLNSNVTKETKFRDFERIRKLAEGDERLVISLMNDFAFQTTFRNKKALTGLLSALLQIPAEEIKDLAFPSPFVKGEYPEEKQGILDVKVILNHNKKIDIEIQVHSFPHWEERTLFYVGKMLTEGVERGEAYDRVSTCIHIGILNFNLSQDSKYYSIFELRDRENHRLYSDKISLRVLELKKLKYASEEEKHSDIYQWARMITAKDWEVFEMLAKKNEYMKEAVSELEKINTDKEKRYQYLEREMAMMDEATIRKYYTKKGIELGEARGKAEDVLELLQETGEVPKSIQDRVMNERNIEVLRKWLKIAAKAESVEEFMNQI